ncbi:dCMP_cyt_deam_1 domain-containing protein/dCMP_cyt_deam_2 domain-containing protein [Cephalotus follicularis]|uniref:cytidine deaminase n=1 Tax=Cephalotus follicularis TaxID=3775 RepID=A0A1Q3BJX4_CEPFO|nr:dCMP_cyt_deam_1 domain-containing protein/dCMP_cyt_deam_2 domain-containing protein [Cephalotus follicularis]
MDGPKFLLEASEAETLAHKSGHTTVLQVLPSLVAPAQALARPPISNFHVGAVGLGSSGRVFLGVNLEFPGLPLHNSVHAEQFLLTNLSFHSEPKLHYLAVSAAPCGHCRQFLHEIRNAPDIQILVTDNHLNQFDSLSRFLPHRFGPGDLLDEDVPLLLEHHDNRLCLRTNNGEIHVDDLLRHAALEAANRSHAPYSGCPSGVALVDCEGKVYKGSYMESAAHNPSLGPVQAAIVAYVASGGGGYERIVRAVLVEMEEAKVRQEHTARLLLQVTAPKCEFKLFHCFQTSKKPTSCG